MNTHNNRQEHLKENVTDKALSGFIITKSDVLSLLQDQGRFGHFNLGLTNGGALDPIAFHWANCLCNNQLDNTVIEVSVGGFAMTAQVDTHIAITGAKMPFTINGEVKSLWQSYKVKAGDTIELGFAAQGLRCYIAVDGGFDISNSFGSSSTVCRESIGGLQKQGSKLQINDVIPCTNSAKNRVVKLFKLEEHNQPSYGNDIILRTIPSYQQHCFSSHQQRLFYSSEYQVSKHFDRMGYRLEGTKIKASIDGVLSEGICHGAIQIPADGQPIVLLNDRQTIGGYPKIGAVISLDTAKLSQLGQGGKVHFEPISMERAHNLYHLSVSVFNRTLPIAL